MLIQMFRQYTVRNLMYLLGCLNFLARENKKLDCGTITETNTSNNCEKLKNIRIPNTCDMQQLLIYTQ